MHRAPNKMDMFRVSNLEADMESVYEEDSVSSVSEPKEIQETKSEVKSLRASTSGIIDLKDSRGTTLKNLSERLVEAAEDLEDKTGGTSRSLFNMIEYTKKLTQRIEAKPSLFDCSMKYNSSDMLVKENETSEVQNQETLLLGLNKIPHSVTQADSDEQPVVKSDDLEKEVIMDEAKQLVPLMLDEQSEPTNKLDNIKEDDKKKPEFRVTFSESSEIQANPENVSQLTNEISVNNPEILMFASFEEMEVKDVAEQMSPAEEDYYFLVQFEPQQDEKETLEVESKPAGEILNEKLQENCQTSASDQSKSEEKLEGSNEILNETCVATHATTSDKKNQTVPTDGLCKTLTHRLEVIDSPFDSSCVCDLRLTQTCLEGKEHVAGLKQEPAEWSVPEVCQPLTQFDLVQIEMVKDVLSQNQTMPLTDDVPVNKEFDVQAIKDYDDIINCISEQHNDKISEDEALTGEQLTVELPAIQPKDLTVSKNSTGTTLKDLEEPLLEAIRQKMNGSVEAGIPVPSNLAERTKDLSTIAGSIRKSLNEICNCDDSSMFLNRQIVEVPDIENANEVLSQTSVCNSWPRLDDEDGYLKIDLKLSSIPQISSTAWIDENASFVVTEEPSVHIRTPLGLRAHPHQVETASSLVVEPQLEQKDSKMRRCKCFIKKRFSKIFKTNN